MVEVRIGSAAPTNRELGSQCEGLAEDGDG